MLCALLRFAPFSPARTLHHARHSRRSTYARHTVRDQIHRISPRKRRQDDVAPRGCAEEDDAIQARRGWPSEYDAQRKHRMSWMHWLHDKPKHARWAKDWQMLSNDTGSLKSLAQEAQQAELSRLETVHFGSREKCFVAESAHVFAEPGRDVVVGAGAHIGADVYLHGPVTLEAGVSVNARCHIDGGNRGIVIGASTRLGPGCYLFAFNHGIDPTMDIKDQPVSSEGITIGQDCWLGASVCVTDGVVIGDHAVIGIGAVVTGNVPEWAIMGGNPARQIGDRRTWASRARGNRANEEEPEGDTIP